MASLAFVAIDSQVELASDLDKSIDVSTALRVEISSGSMIAFFIIKVFMILAFR